MGPDDVLRITMGAVVDYYQPAGDMTFCTFLGLSGNNQFKWSASDCGPWESPSYDQAAAGNFGGSEKNWPKDGREFLSCRQLPQPRKQGYFLLWGATVTNLDLRSTQYQKIEKKFKKTF